MSYTIVIACVAATWAFLALLGSAETARREGEKQPELPTSSATPAADVPAA